MAEKKLELKEDSRILSPSTTVDQWAPMAFDTYKSSVKGLPEMKMRYNKYVSPVIGRLPISKVTALQCQQILNCCEGMSFSHCNKLRQEIRFLFQTALDNDLIKKDPAARITLPSYNKGVRRSITDHEREHLYKVYEAYPPFILFIMMLRCGCRPAEAAGLIGRDINHSQKLMGHANISITADIYTHVDKKQILDAGNKINAYFEATQKVQ